MRIQELGYKQPSHTNMTMGTVGHAVLKEFFGAKKPDMDKALACTAMTDYQAQCSNQLGGKLNDAERLYKALVKYMRIHLPIQSPQVTAQWWQPLSVNIQGAVTPADGKYLLGEMPLVVDLSQELGIKDALVGGIPDLPILQTKVGVHQLVDFKFTGNPLTAYLGERFRLSFQAPLYMYMLRKVTGLDFQQGIMEAIFIGEEGSWKLGQKHSYTPVTYWTKEEEERLLHWLRARILEYKWRSDNDIWPEISGQYTRQKICKGCYFNSVCSTKIGGAASLARGLRRSTVVPHDPSNTPTKMFKSGVV